MSPSRDVRGTWGIVLAGVYLKGRSLFERLRPRPLLPVALRPIVGYPLRWLSDADVAGVTVCLNGASRDVRLAVEAEGGAAVSFREDLTPRGTAGATRDAAAAAPADTFLVMNASAILSLDPRAVLEAHHREHAAVTVVVRRSTEPAGLGPLGAYVIDRRALDLVPTEGFQDLKETLLPRLHQAGERIATVEVDGPDRRVVDAGTYLATNACLIGETVERGVPAGFLRVGHALVHASARVSPTARLVGPVILGPEVAVEAGATVVGPTAVGAGGHVGAGAIVSRSVLWDGCAIGAGGLVDRSLVADGAVVPEGAEIYGAIHSGAGAFTLKSLADRQAFAPREPAAAGLTWR